MRIDPLTLTMADPSHYTEKVIRMAKRATYRVNADGWWKLQDILCAHPEEFNSDSATLKGRSAETVYPHTGRLSGESEELFREARAEDRILYVIYSYSTPIAWLESTVAPNRVKGSNGHTVGYSHTRWMMPRDKYSVTTSKHQGKVATALSQISGGI